MSKKKNSCFVLIIGLIFILVGCARDENYAPVINGWCDPSAMKSRYRVQEGDTIYSIACAFELDYRDLARINHLTSPYHLQRGETLSMYIHPDNLKTSTVTLVETAKPIQKSECADIEQKPDIPEVKLSVKQLVLPEVELKPNSMNLEKPKLLPAKTLDNPRQTNNQSVKKGVFWPTEGKIIKNFDVQNPCGNKGIDIAGNEGDVIKAVGNGQVVYCGSSLPGYGNLIILKHNESYLTLYGNNKKILVKEGDFVKKGTQIAEMGRCNNGVCMLHFEVRKCGKPVNPSNFIQQD